VRWLFFLTLAISVLVQIATVAVPFLAGQMVRQAVELHRLEALPRLTLEILALFVIRGALNWAEIYFGSRAGQAVSLRLREAVYTHLLQLRFRFFDRTRTGQLLSRLTSDLEPINGFVRWGLRLALKNTSLFLLSLLMALRIDAPLAWISLGSLPLIALTAWAIGTRIRPAFERAREQLGVVTSRLQDNLQGIRVVKTYVQEDREIERFTRESDLLRGMSYEAARIDAIYYPLTGFWSGMALIIVLFAGGSQVITGRLTLDQYFTMSLLVMQLVVPMRFLGYMISVGQRAAAACDRVFAILEDRSDVEPLLSLRIADCRLQITDGPASQSAIRDPQTAIYRSCPDLRGDVRFEGVQFAYDGTEVLHGIDLDVRAGEVIGIVDTTGSGKSTLMSLIPAFYHARRGRVRVDGHDVTQLEPEGLRRQIGFVFQEPFLFPGTLRDNLLFGRPEATEEEMIAAARDAAIHDFIQTLEHGYDTVIGERGLTLSGGQQQRLTIARTILMNPSILILDDYTSSVDTYTEHLIQSALARLMRGRTTFIITPRAAPLMEADRVVVMDEGRIVCEGPPAELASRPDNLFYQLLELQSSQQLAGAH
jgi:ABC-type multidrug transport system fused ATPase/permease subunit